MTMTLLIHIATGGLALVFGAVALLVKKGGSIHRRAGVVFVYAMLAMGISASILGDVVGGLLSAYFVVTALTTVRRESQWTRWTNNGALALVVILLVGTWSTGVQAFRTPGLSSGGVPYRTIGVMSFFLGVCMSLAAIGDVRVMRFGALKGAPRLKRHLWRMCIALFIAAGSFFSIRERVARVLPDPFPSLPMRILPILVVFAAMLYWLWKLRGRRASLPS